MADAFGTDDADLITPGGVSLGVNGTPDLFTINDHIFGFGGNDTIEGGAGTDTMFGGEGDDRFLFQVGWGGGGEIVDGDDGTDTFDFSAVGAGFTYIIDLINGFKELNIIEASIIEVENAVDGASSSKVFGTNGTNLLSGGGGNDTLDGRDGRDQLFGDDDNDSLLGGGGIDSLYGQAGDDTLNGGAGKDVLRGGLDDDRFDYDLVSDSPFSANGANCDELRGGNGGAAFDGPGNAVGDLIDVDGIDAKDNFGEQDFQFGLGGGGGTEGRLWCVNGANNTTLVRANVDNDPDVDFQIIIFDGAGMLANAYKAVDFDL